MNEELILKRRNSVFNYVKWKGRATVEEISASLRMSPSTVRRDLKKLADENKVIQFHGGVAVKSGDDPFSERQERESEAKRMIGAAAVRLVKPHNVIYIGGGSTTHAFAKELASDKNATDTTIVCAAVNIAICFAESFNFNVILLGGVFNRLDESMTSPLTISNIETFNFDCVFLGASAISKKSGYCLPTLELAELKKFVIKRADQTVLLADHTKIGRAGGFSICPLEDITAVVTDSIADTKADDDLLDSGVDIILA